MVAAVAQIQLKHCVSIRLVLVGSFSPLLNYACETRLLWNLSAPREMANFCGRFSKLPPPPRLFGLEIY
jgi:hypothetical protein